VGRYVLVLCLESFVGIVLLEVEPVAGGLLEVILRSEVGYLCKDGFVGLIGIFSFLVEVEVVLFLRVTPLFVPVSDKSFGLELAGVV
jgi:hypothetical protein